MAERKDLFPSIGEENEAMFSSEKRKSEKLREWKSLFRGPSTHQRATFRPGRAIVPAILHSKIYANITATTLREL